MVREVQKLREDSVSRSREFKKTKCLMASGEDNLMNPLTREMILAIRLELLKCIGNGRLVAHQTSGFQHVVPRPAASTTPGNFSEIQIQSLIPRAPELQTPGWDTTICLNKSSR